jgi:cyclic beta-1,2-glucan synthetase
VDPASRDPIRAELFGLDHLEAHARQVARAARVGAAGRAYTPLRRRFDRNGRELVEAHRRIAEASGRRQPLTPDAEWLLDNFHIIEETLREVRQDLPRGYYNELPKLADGPCRGLPRVYALSLELIAHTDSGLDEGNVTRFVQAYQSVVPLTIGELWAVPIMLRVGLLENLTRLARQMLHTWAEREKADEIAAGLARELPACPPPGECWSDPCLVRILQALRDRGSECTAAVEWLEARLAALGTNRVDVLRREHQRQAANQVSVGNCVTSLRLLSNLDWAVFFERTSLAEVLLRNDPAGVYARQDFPTRDRYRRAVEKLARRSGLDEPAVIRRALSLAGRAAERGGDDEPAAHIGHYLVGDGRPELEREVRYRPAPGPALLRGILRRPGLVYFGSLAAVTAALLAGLVAYAGAAGAATWPWLLLVFAAVFLPATDLAVALVHYVLTLLLPPRVLPKFDFKDGIPADCATFVVVPTLLVRAEGAADLVDRLEVHYLSNPDPQLRFALLTDFADAPAEHQPDDEKLLRGVLDRIKALNERYAPNGPDRFFLFHRRRLWNPAQGCWMGWERKRGKLTEFNRLLRGATDTSYTVLSGDPASLPHTRYVITLDADTQMPREAARRLVATLAHPLNRPRFDPAQGRVVAGYGVLQPRVSLSLLAATRSLFAKILASSAGLDPYTTAVSDVYQDLFGRGTYTGKGVYDVDAFEAAVGATFPENHILSHDLIEGNYARCGLVTDIELIDDFPARYHAYARREHRWVRGDWQILPWLFGKVPAPLGSPAPAAAPGVAAAAPPHARRAHPLPALERWKILDNLRRSLVPPALVALLALGWTVLPGSPWVWSALALLGLGMPLVLLLLGCAVSLVNGGSWKLQLYEMAGSVGATAGQALLSVAFLAAQAFQMLDAVGRTLYRLLVSRRHLLDWETASATDRRLGAGFLHFCLTMWTAPALAAGLAALVAWAEPGALPAAAPFLLGWFASPAVAWYVSRPRVVVEAPLTAEERRDLRRVARKTWHFFDTFVTAEDHWLPPDNFQEDPKGVVAHRTSPTNMGLYLLSALAAHDFGYLTLSGLAGRLEDTFAAFDRLERFHGHFHNWYDTRTLAVLPAPYISTVDSGNLLACLLTVGQGLHEKARRPADLAAMREGLADTLKLVAEAVRDLEPTENAVGQDVFGPLEGALRELLRLAEEAPADLLAAYGWLGRLGAAAGQLDLRQEALGRSLGEAPEQLADWVGRFLRQAGALRSELAGLAPWLEAWPADEALVAHRAPLPAAAPHGNGAAAPGPGPAGRNGEEVAGRWDKVRRLLLTPAAPAEAEARQKEALTALADLQALGLSPEGRAALAALADAVGRSGAAALRQRLRRLAERAAAFAQAMDFRLLYNEQRHLFSIGFNRSAGRLDQSHYDLLASEASLTSFLAVARGEAPKRHWFQLGRQITRAGGGIALLSWGGTIFEYLMPRLLLRGYGGTLLDESDKGAVARQIEYGRQMRVPWGISESGFYALDAALDYQYQSFGVPGLGLKRGLSRDLVVAPYATALAVMLRPHAARENFRALAQLRCEGRYGFFEAIDFTRDRVTERRQPVVVRSYMAHHQGMTLAALANCLLDWPMVRRFHAEPAVRATELLLQERVPRVAPLLDLHEDETRPAPVVRDGVQPVSRRITTARTPHPRTHLLSNGQYTVMLTNAGGGSSAFRDLDVTRWREDRTADCWGQWVYLRDLRGGLVWSATHQPVGRAPDFYEVIYSTDKAEFRRQDGGIETHLEVAVSPENAAEVRRLVLTNHNLRPAEVEVTSYAEVVLLPHRADAAHPAFGKLFLETEWVAEETALLCRRRPRSAEQEPVWAVHALSVDGPAGEVQFETDRARFLGRGRTTARPAALDPGATLSGTTGPVLDPVFSIRRRVRIAPGASVGVAFTTAVAASREEAMALADQYHDFHGVTRAFELAWAHTQVQLRHLHLSAEEAHLFQRLAAHVLYAGPALRAPAGVLAANRQGQQGLWRLGISGDKPIVLVRVAEGDELPLVRQALLAHSFWRLQGLEVDLVLVNEHPSGYLEELHQQLQGLVRASDSHHLVDKPGGVFLRKADHLSEEDKVLLQAAARVMLVGARGSMEAQVDRREPPASLPPPLEPADAVRPAPPGGARPPADLRFFNGVGGFTPDGREYVVALPEPARAEPRPTRGRPFLGAPRVEAPPAQPPAGLPPAPWSNVVANPHCGFLASESGGGYTWAENSQTNRLTPWANDPVSDPPGEVVYLRDEDTGEVWTPAPLPLGAGRCVVRHGHGSTTFQRGDRGLEQELTLFVPPDDPVKLLRLRVRNTGPAPRRLSATFYAELVLGTVREQAQLYVVTSMDAEGGAVLARSAFAGDYANQIAFADVNLRPRSATGDRTEFLGRNGSAAAPAALKRTELGGRFGPALDPCAAVMAPFELAPGAEQEVVFVLGQAAAEAEARRLAERYRAPGTAAEALRAVREGWDRLLGAVEVRTPDPAFDVLVNRWLLYQVLSCRVWGRTGLYQSSGAYGFRDQLQDVTALVHADPQEARRHILRAAGRQFLEGDVQHWWHPPLGRGIRTRFSDDFLWLPLCVARYVDVTGDAALLDEPVTFLRAPLLKPGQEEEYGLPQVTEEKAPVYEHCARAVDHGLRYGAHGLPLMGTGDWNDGMNKVGAGGKGESVWNGWFQLAILPRWAEFAERRGDAARAARYREEVARLKQAMQEAAWDGDWYRRAYFDDGTPLGSKENDECKIDALPQSWAVISGLADPERARRAAQSAYEWLVRREEKLILLLTPPFDKGPLQPGYIKGYVPGIRENGGQYTHGVVWTVLAAALLGDGNRAAELFGLLNPVHHGSTPGEVTLYKGEPYVMAGDVYGAPPHTGRCGWTWYTGSAGWMYRTALEAMLGFRREADRLRVEPCVPSGWPGFELTYRHGSATYHIMVENPTGVERGVRSVTLDGAEVAGGVVALADDGRRHEVRVVMG